MSILDVQKYIKCRFQQDVFDDYLKCTHFRTSNILLKEDDVTEYIIRIVEFFSGKWFKIINKESKPNLRKLQLN